MTPWEPVLEMDLDDGTHTCYSAYVRGKRVWITQMSDNTWDIEMETYEPQVFTTICTCKTLTSAKRYVSRYLK